MANRFDNTPNYNGPRFGVVQAEAGLYVAAIFAPNGQVMKADGRRMAYGDAWVHAAEWSRGFVADGRHISEVPAYQRHLFKLAA